MSEKTDIQALISFFQELRKSFGPDQAAFRSVCDKSAWLLSECASSMTLAATQLELAVKLRAGLQDSLSRHEEIARQKNLTMEEQAKFLRKLLNLRTPGYTDQLDPDALGNGPPIVVVVGDVSRPVVEGNEII